MPADGSTHIRSRELMSSEHPFDAGLLGFEEPTYENHTSLSVEAHKSGLWFSICSDGQCVELWEGAAEHFAKDILSQIEARKQAILRDQGRG